jgi:hypothetical protein
VARRPAEAGERPSIATAPDDVPGAPRRRAVTAWGGLLFCLNLLDPRSGRAPGEPDPTGPTSRYELHAVGERLVRRVAPTADPPEPGDPALLAFCGLPPGSAPPDPPVACPRGDALDARAAALAAAVLARLGTTPGGPADEAGALAGVLRRTAEVVGDPGWIDVLFDLDSVTVEVRAAGLDLDPGWLPVVGCAVRFRYV